MRKHVIISIDVEAQRARSDNNIDKFIYGGAK